MIVKHLRASLVLLVTLTVLLGLVYPLVLYVIGQAIFPYQANGSLLYDTQRRPIASELIGQYFSDPKYFWGRPSATSPVPYTAFNAEAGTGSSGSNYGPLNPALIGNGSNKTTKGTVKAAVDALLAADPGNTAPIPVDLVTASASGLDPDISPAAAKYQVHRIAKARGLDDTIVQQLVDRYTSGRMLGVLGEPYVNVLLLNLALDKLPGQTLPSTTPISTAAPTASP